MKGLVQIHVLDESDDKMLVKQLVSCVPRQGDEIRVGGEGAERYYKVLRVVWVFDEPDTPYGRVNIGAEWIA